MNPSALVWQAIGRLYAAGHKGLAAKAASVFSTDRKFAIDADGHWMNWQERAAFASPDPHGQRLSYIERKIADQWFYRYTPKPGDIVLDGGAGIGEETVIMARLVKEWGKVISVEAHPNTYQCLSKTVYFSELSNVDHLQCALAGEDGEIMISDGADHLGNSVTQPGSIKVVAKTIPGVCRQLGVNRIDFLKLNIEGAEADVLRAMGDIPVLNMAVSCHDFIGCPTFDKVAAILTQRGYSLTTRRDHRDSWTRFYIYAWL